LCHGVKIHRYEYDYVCVYDNGEKYGYDYRRAKSNPCLTSYNGLYPFAFSYFGHIECNMGHLYFRNGQLPKVDQYKEALGTYNTDTCDIPDPFHKIMNKLVNNIVTIFVIFASGLAWVVAYIPYVDYNKERRYLREKREKNSPYNPKNRKNKKTGQRKVRNLLLNCYIF